MQVFNRHISPRGLTVFGFETVLITGAILLSAQMHGSFNDAVSGVWRVMFITALCELCFYYNELYDLTVVHSTTELAVRILQGAGAVAIVLAALSVLAPGILIGSGTFLTALGILLVAVPAWRLAFDGVLRDPHIGRACPDPWHRSGCPQRCGADWLAARLSLPRRRLRRRTRNGQPRPATLSE